MFWCVVFSFVTFQTDDKSILTVQDEKPGENVSNGQGVSNNLEQIDLGDKNIRISEISG